MIDTSASTTPENVQSVARVFVMPGVTNDHRSSVSTLVAPVFVVDNPTYAWRNNESGVLNQLPADFVHDYRAHLDEHAPELIRPLLIDVWTEHGYRVRFGTEDQVFHRDGNPDDVIYHRVWDEAASRLDVDLLVKTADLADIRDTYRD